jgi:hypothetical protein
MRDLCFLDTDTDKVVPVPFKITGDCSGRAVTAQRVMTMALRSLDDPARVDALGLGGTVGRSNISSDFENQFTLILSNIEDIIKEDQSVRTDLADDEILDTLRVESLESNEDEVVATIAIITVDGTTFYGSFTI